MFSGNSPPARPRSKLLRLNGLIEHGPCKADSMVENEPRHCAPPSRRQARILAMQALCQWDVQQVQSAQELLDLFERLEADPQLFSPAVELVERFWETRQSVDEQIGSAVTRWDLSRVSPVERNIMRVAVVEVLSGATPPRVALDEAIELGREFGGGDSPRFINGVLDAVLRRLGLLAD